MTSNAIEVRGVSKRYRLGPSTSAYTTLRESLAGAFRRDAEARSRDLWALSSVDLAVSEGEAIGIIGANGAGKTTLLKILARITEPTSGVARTRGRVGLLLEVGAGFHSELTGRENIFLNGAILGMARSDVRERFDEIVSFAGIGRFLDTPLKRYSSGMYLRLAFSVAAHLEPEIMLVDEVLAVGDAEFQRKCLGKMSELGGHGRTVVFVSHDLGAIGRLCSRAVWLDSGRVRADGSSHGVIDEYVRSAVSTRASVDVDQPRGGDLELRSMMLLDEAGAPTETPRRDRPLSLRVRFTTRTRRPDIDMAIYLATTDGSRVIDERWSDASHDQPLCGEPGVYEVTVRVPSILRPAEYVAGVWIGTELETFAYRDLLRFTVLRHPHDRHEALERPRAVQPTLEWSRSVASTNAARPR